MTDDNSSLFHAGEIAVQERAGVADFVRGYGTGFMRAFMPDQHRTFFSSLPFVSLGLLDGAGRPWAVPAFGQQGFITSPDPETLAIAGQPLLAKSLQLDLGVGAKAGIVGIELQTRRRNRMNGEIIASGSDGLTVHVDQSFGNCPKYIQKRAPHWRRPNLTDPAASHSTSLTPAAITQIEHADTFFIASRTADLRGDMRNGVDASHRGGRPGFLQVRDDQVLSFPDFTGNRFFNTLGNIALDARVGLYFPDFTTGDVVVLTGTASIVWDGDRVTDFVGAERLVDVTVHEVVHVHGVMALAAELVEPSPFLRKTGTWGDLN